jgi:hypothetical protein
LFGTVDGRTFSVGNILTSGRTSDPPLKPTGAVFLGGGRTLEAAESDAATSVLSSLLAYRKVSPISPVMTYRLLAVVMSMSSLALVDFIFHAYVS